MTCVGARHPPPVTKLSLSPLSKLSNFYPHIHSKQTLFSNSMLSFPLREEEDFEEEMQEKTPRREVDVVSNAPSSTLHLPQIMKSFLPGVSRKAPIPTKSTWGDLISQKKIKQVAPTHYKRPLPVG